MIPVAVYFAFYIPSVQLHVKQKITTTLSSALGTKVEIGNIHYKLFRRAHISDFLIRDIKTDTLIYVHSADARISLKLTSLIGKSYVFDKVTAEGAYVRFIIMPGGEPNYGDIFKSARRDSSKKFWPYFGIRSMTITGTRFKLKTGASKSVDKVNFKDLQLSSLSAEIRNFEVFKQQTRMRIRNLVFRDKCGWLVNSLNLNFEIAPDHIDINRVSMALPFSNIHANHLRFYYNDFSDFSDFKNKVRIDLDLRQSALGYRDLTWFLTDPSTIRNNIFISGRLKGTISDIQVNRLRLQSGFESEFVGNIEAIGLPDIQNTYLYVDVRLLKSSIRDLQTFYRPGTHKLLHLPDNFDAFGNLAYRGNFTGFISDFVSYGTLQTDIGDFSGDISFKTDSADQLVFQGQLNTYQLDIGKFLKKNTLAGQMTMNMHVDGRAFQDNRFRTNLKGIIDSIELNNYIFHHVAVDGLFTEKTYDGSIRIEDPNLRLDFAGLVDFTNRTPEFDFSLNIPRANLFPLHFENEDSAAFFSCLVLANFTGSGPDSLNGRINLLDAQIKRGGRQLEVYDVALKAASDSSGKLLTLSSAYAEGSLKGNYDFSTLKFSFQNLFSRYFPGTFSSPESLDPAVNNFVFKLVLTNPDPFRFFLPGFDFKDQIQITGRYSPVINLAGLTLSAPQVSFNDAMADSLLIEAGAEKEKFNIVAGTKSFKYKKLLKLANLQTDISCSEDTINSYLSWFSGDSVSNRSNLHFLTGINSTGGRPFSAFTITNDQGRLWINDAWWNLSKGSLKKDTTFLQFDHLSLSRGTRLFTLYGILSDHTGDTLTARFRDLNLASLSHRNRNGKLSLNGILSGSLQVTGGRNRPLFFSEMKIADLKVNGENLGNTLLVSRWDTARSALAFQIKSSYKNRNPVLTNGSYIPATGKINAYLAADKIQLSMFSPFTDVVFHDLTGLFSGNIHASGPISKPVVSGTVSLQRTVFTVAYINTRYGFSADIPLNNNRFDLSGIKIFDTQGNSATSKGYLSVEDFKNPVIDLNLNARNMFALNISEKDNDIFYGRAFGTGVISIHGPLKDVSLNISATTEKNTEIYLPLGNGQSISTFDFIEFVSQKNGGKTVQKTRKTGIRQQGINMTLDLHATPDAEVSLIFDPATGEVLRSRGHGDLQLVIKKESGFSMYGEYIEDQGDYLFTLQNIINKKFRLTNGGTISFNGDPLDAEIDIQAVYPVKTSLYQLLYDENYQRRIPVECQIKLTGKLQQPNIAFDIYLPTADEDTRTKVQNAISSQEELSKQFLSLLIINSFYPDPSYGQPGILSTAGTIGVTTTEVLSNQLSNWLSQISNDFDIGFSYHPGDEVTSEQVEVALSTQLLNDRVSINGNVDFRGQQTNTSTNNIVGDFQIEVKLTDNGKLRIKAFTRANDKFIYETAPYTNGIGIFYREEFNSWNRLMAQYWERIFTGKKKE